MGLAVLLWLCAQVLQVSAAQVTTVEVMVTQDTVERAAKGFLGNLDLRYTRQCQWAMSAAWNYHANTTVRSWDRMQLAQDQFDLMIRQGWLEARDWTRLRAYIRDPSLARQLLLLSRAGPKALEPGVWRKYDGVLRNMTRMYDRATVCHYHNPHLCDLTIGEGLHKVVRNSRDEGELRHVWEGWRASLAPLRPHYTAFVTLANAAAQANGYPDMALMERAQYETHDFQAELDDVWREVRPLYEHLHAYTRRKLRKEYGRVAVRERGPLPAHLLGNLWGAAWKPRNLLTPFPDSKYLDVSQELLKQAYTSRGLFEVADEFFTSLGLEQVPPTFWRGSLFGATHCRTSSWDMCDKKDYRVKACEAVDQDGFVSAHHEMTHVQYFLQYRDLPYVFRDAPSPGLHEAVAHAVGLSAGTSRHLWRLGLLGHPRLDPEVELNGLMRQALEVVVELSYALALDRWRWRVFEGEVEARNMNCEWWDLRYQYQGIKPPTTRTEDDFDPASKYHLTANIPYTKHVMSIVLRFQLLRSLCVAAKEYDPNDARMPLHQCDFYRSHQAGEALRRMMQLGASKPWQEAVEAGTGQRRLDASALREYFRPLEEWLQKDNAKHNEYVGWRPDGEYCTYQRPRDVPRCPG